MQQAVPPSLPPASRLESAFVGGGTAAGRGARVCAPRARQRPTLRIVWVASMCSPCCPSHRGYPSHTVNNDKNCNRIGGLLGSLGADPRCCAMPGHAMAPAVSGTVQWRIQSVQLESLLDCRQHTSRDAAKQPCGAAWQLARLVVRDQGPSLAARVVSLQYYLRPVKDSQFV